MENGIEWGPFMQIHFDGNCPHLQWKQLLLSPWNWWGGGRLKWEVPSSKGNFCFAFSYTRGGWGTLPALVDSRLPSAQNNAYAKVAYLGVSCSIPILRIIAGDSSLNVKFFPLNLHLPCSTHVSSPHLFTVGSDDFSPVSLIGEIPHFWDLVFLIPNPVFPTLLVPTNKLDLLILTWLYWAWCMVSDHAWPTGLEGLTPAPGMGHKVKVTENFSVKAANNKEISLVFFLHAELTFAKLMWHVMDFQFLSPVSVFSF